jgi:hypothetical protein
MGKSEIIIYSSEDGLIKIQTRLENETVWLTQAQMAILFGKDRTVITKHITNIFKENELDKKSNVQNLHIANSDKPVKIYNLDVIISVGYRVKSLQGTKFRQWATARLREYIVKGFTMNDEILKQAGGGNYFEELLARIRDIRSSEKVFWRKVLDIYATSIDYDPKSESSLLFFQIIQNKMHWAAHGNTAAEIVYKRIDATKPNLGLTNFKGNKPTKQETEIAKNFLTAEELNILNRIVSAYLDLAEIQALNRKRMYMKNWIEKLDEFIKISGNEILQHSGTISHQQAIDKAHNEYNKFNQQTINDLSEAEKHFIQHLENDTKKLKGK